MIINMPLPVDMKVIGSWRNEMVLIKRCEGMSQEDIDKEVSDVQKASLA